MNDKTARWLQSIKIQQTHINEASLQNGYLFGLIFEKMNLLKGKDFIKTKIKNTKTHKTWPVFSKILKIPKIYFMITLESLFQPMKLFIVHLSFFKK